MNRTELIAEARTRLNDLQVPYKYRESSMILWANEAVIEANRRARLLISNSETVSVTSGTTEYALPSESIFIRRVKISTEELPLDHTSYRILDEDVAGWESHTGTPTEYFTDMNTGYFSIYPNPTEDYTLNLTVIKEPTLGETIVIPDRYHYSLVFWILFRAHSIPFISKEINVESQLRQSSIDNLSLFENEFGKKSSAINEVFDSRNLPLTNLDGTY